MALAIFDDLGAIVIIALFHTDQLSLPDLATASMASAVLVGLNRRRVDALWAYLLVGAVLWYFLWRSGIHATLAGVIVGFAVPLRREGAEGEA